MDEVVEDPGSPVNDGVQTVAVADRREGSFSGELESVETRGLLGFVALVVLLVHWCP
ncbi:hypothetical protein [Rhodococcus sp. (in: high G+C Gram-positive bacteria)]|uniref:hypothetical protein n=1 Tax=Rhodococcus sp. TaxID=1831 RepID=UPI00257BB900|nr:hypothetical protein [Rhodococcus sp. (in: high G+C Gram-positive bacteria)]MBQ7803070.1 hypothetical protein [Rhodococcus sp. (in: high G+C Gram-positive bacteria)]